MVLGDPARHDAWLGQENDEECAEDLRLLYVGLTRARLALHVTWGHTWDSNGSAMHWLLHGDEKAGRQKDKLQPDGMRTHIDELAAESNGRIAVQPMPSSVPAATLSEGVDKQGLDTSEERTATAQLPRGGGQYSFSGLRGEHRAVLRSEEHRAEIQSIMRNSHAGMCLK